MSERGANVMPEWVVTLIAVAAVAALVGLAVWSLIKDRKKGSTCGGKCGSCPYGESCGKQNCK